MALTPSDLRRRKMNLLMAMSYAAFASTKASTWSPTLLFAAGEQGAWYDPSDFTTMFQDSAGTTPVTAVEQPVGLLLDKSKGLALGAELVTNGDFATDTNWTKGTDWSINSGVATKVAGVAALLEQGILLTAGKTYRLQYTISGYSAGGITPQFSGGTVVSATQRTANGTYSEYVFAVSGNNNIRFNANASFAGLIDNISVRELPGNHASQSTAASRPVLSARVNLLTYSEQFDNAAWTKTGLTVSQNTTVAPDGTTTADSLVWASGTGPQVTRAAATVTAGSPLKYTLSAKAGTKSSVMLILFTDGSNFVTCTFDLASGTAGTPSVTGAQYTGAAATIAVEANGFYRCTLTSNTNTLTSVATWVRGDTMVGSGDAIIVWGADLRVTNVGVGLPAYQRIAAATDYDTNGFPLALKFDGVDDSLATGSIDPGSVDKAQVFAGVRKLSDVQFQTVVELSPHASNNAGAFVVFAPDVTATYLFRSNGSLTPSSALSPASFAAPITNVLTGLSAISGDFTTLRVNSAQAAQSTTDQGTGNYLAYPLYIGRRGGSTLPFNGQVYSMIVRFSAANLSDAQIASTETWVNGKTKAY